MIKAVIFGGARGAGLIPIRKPFAGEWPPFPAPPAFAIRDLNEIPAILEKLS